MSNNSVNANNGASRSSNLQQVKFGAKRTDMKTAEQKSIFDKLDTNRDGIISEKDSSVVTGKIRNKDGQFIEKKYVKLQDLPQGRSLVADANGKTWVMSHDGIILKEDYVSHPEKYSSKQNRGNSTENGDVEQLAEQFYQNADDNSSGASMTKMQKLSNC